MSDPRTEPSMPRPLGEPSTDALTGAPAVSDELLLRGVRMRDEQAFGQLYDRHGGLVFTLALRVLGDRNLAEEVMQDVFLRCWNGLDQFDPTRGTVPAWLFGIARHRAIHVLCGREHQACSHERDALTEGIGSELTTPDRTEEVVVRATVSQALNELAEPQRAAIELAYYGGLTQTKVATRLGEPLGTVKTNIRDGMRRLRRVLAPVTETGPAREGGAP
jgi:RNA polymerase sigma-70 factor (ECF subfamily)